MSFRRHVTTDLVVAFCLAGLQLAASPTRAAPGTTKPTIVSGVVVSSDGHPVVGATIRVGVTEELDRPDGRPDEEFEHQLAVGTTDRAVTFTDTDTESRKTHATYVLKHRDGEGFLCGKDNDIVQASFVEEIDAP